MLLFCDSFDHYDTAHLGEKYLSSSASIQSGGRGGGSCLLIAPNGAVTKAFQNDARFIVGFAFNPVGLSDVAIVRFFDISHNQGELRLNTSGGLEYHTFPNGQDTLVAASPNGIIALNTYQYIEVNVLFAASTTGSVAGQVNGINVFSVTGIATSSSGNSYANTVQVLNGSGFSNNFQVDDLYMCDGSGTINNDFLGDVSIKLLLPNGNGAFSNFGQVGGTSGEHYTSVDEVPPDDDTSYVFSSNPGDVDAYTLSSVGSPSAIVAIQLVASARKDDSFTRVLALGFGDGTTFDFDAGYSLTSNYVMYTQPYDEDPISSAPWTISNLNNGQIAIKVIA